MTSFPPNPSLHKDPEILKRCPYCNPKPAPPKPSMAERAQHNVYNPVCPCVRCTDWRAGRELLQQDSTGKALYDLLMAKFGSHK